MQPFLNLPSGHPSSPRVNKCDHRRWIANQRERKRVRLMRVAYRRLEEILPWDPTETKLARVDIVCRAIERIRNLETLLTSHSSPCLHHLGYGKYPDDASSVALAPITDHVHAELSLSDNECTDSREPDFGDSAPRRRIKPHRLKINAKLRQRARETKEGFEALRRVVPVTKSEPYPGQAQVSRRAKDYIALLSELL